MRVSRLTAVILCGIVGALGGALTLVVGQALLVTGVLLGGPAPRPLVWAGIAVVAAGLTLGFMSRSRRT